ncbi:MAG: superoxide dismutase [Caulobacteraceae bacterium]|nr:superoxide dismutase [Caulobacteraceae bacterium]
MPHTLPPLPYAYDALSPVLSEAAMRLHHEKHHKAYVDNLNKALALHPDYAAVPVEELLRNLEQLPENLRTPIRNHGGGHANHSLYWQVMAPPGSVDLPPSLKRELESAFGDLEAFRARFAETGAKLFGSGWAWLTVDATGALEILGLPNQDSPLSTGRTPLLLVDVWEHAYYPDYQNRRPDWLQAWWEIVDWEAVADRLDQARPAQSPSGEVRASRQAGLEASR